MRKAVSILIVCIIGASANMLAQNKIDLRSPDGKLLFSLQTKTPQLAYTVSFKGEQLIKNAGLLLQFKENDPSPKNLKAGKPIYRQARESYELIVGKTTKVDERFNEVRIPLVEKVRPFRQLHLLVRAFNDGLAFRYEFPKQDAWKAYTLTNEVSTFTPVGNPRLLTLMLSNYTTSHEGEYSLASWNELKEDTLLDVPTLLSFPNNVFMAITEAALVNYAGMYLMKQNGKLVSKLSPLPGEPDALVQADLPHRTPWRVLLISDRIGALVESNLITNLNEPSKLKDVSWIKPGKTTFPWWNGSVIPDTTFSPGNNFESNKYYIDFCARNGLEYHSVVESGGHEWYTNDGENYQPGPKADVTKPVAGLDMQRICDYAKSKGVGIRVWVHWKALYAKIDTALALFEKWGIKGMMIDFMDRDDQEMINIQEEMLRKAAQHKMHVQFHGSHKPTGLSRPYPNEFTREGTLNYEVNKWEKRVTPDHDLNIVFTRMLAGPTDYHLGGFRAVTDSQFQVQYSKPLMLGTRCHMLAMYVVLENYQGMVCDYPAAYEGQPGFEFIQAVPTVWDETKVLNAALQQYVSIARRKGDEWFVGAITNRTGRNLEISFDFLPPGNYIADIYTDASTDPNHLVKQRRQIKRTDKLSVKLLGGGGTVMHLKKQP